MHTTEPEGDEELRATVRRLVRGEIEKWLKDHAEPLKRQIALKQKVAGATVRLSKNGQH